jgi:hypothetical protein
MNKYGALVEYQQENQSSQRKTCPIVTVHHKSHTDWCAIEPAPPWRHTDNQPSELWHHLKSVHIVLNRLKKIKTNTGFSSFVFSNH